MIRSQKLISNSNQKILVLFKPQSKAMCMKKPPCNMISSADHISNLCHIKYAVQENETPLETELRKHREELQAWNEVFWTKHNLNFIKKKKEFLVNKLCSKNEKDSTSVMSSADEISVFYKDFLDKNWKSHLTYLFEWYNRNAYVTYLHLRVNIDKMFKKVYKSI